MSCSSFPALDEIYRELDRIQKQNPDVVTVQTIGRTPEGRDVKAAFAADSAIPADEKETAMVVCGRHGQELGTRLIGTALLEWLVSARGTETLAAQTVIVVPVANPDGCMREEFWAPKDRLSDTERQTIGALAQAYRPDAVIDRGPEAHDGGL